MATDDTLPITFSVPGLSGPIVSAGATRGGDGAPAAVMPGQVKASVRVGLQRDGGAPVRATAVPGEDIVVLHIENGPVLYLHPATARDLLRGAKASSGTGSSSTRGGAGSDDVAVALELQWPGAGAGTGAGSGGGAAARDLSDIGRVLVSGFQVLTSPFKGQAADFAASVVVQKVDSQVDAGVYALRPDGLDKLKGSGRKLAQVPAASEPMLVLLHGTFVETVSTFGKLWTGHSTGVAQLFERYGQRVYALDHPTLGASPIANARTLVDALPSGARLHLVTHSRGGLVAEVLARLAGVKGVLTDADRAFFADPAYAGQQRELRDLAEQVKLKHVQVERVVRVACPARGTLLASKRLDAYVSVLKWTLESAGLPLLPGLVDFIGEVARRRADPSEIPGLAAMMPGTPLVNWLNAAPLSIPGDLRVVAGDLQHGSTIGSWLKSLLADAYYWTDNDIVVNTNSMYGGAPRAGGATFLLDQGPGVTHFAYFENDKTANAVVRALIDSAPPAGFQPIGPLSWAGKDASGQRGLFSEATASAADPRKPAVFVLPGILGSNLKQGTADAAARIWLSPRLIGGFERLAYQPGGADSVQEDGPIGAVYSDLTAYLAATHEVIPFGYDWRRPLEEEAARLALRVKAALDARATTQQPVRILAHSMGGLLARTLQLVDPATWTRLMAHADARFVMLGTPNAGSWAPMQVLSGDDTFGNALAAIGSPFANRKARSLMAQMPGFLQLQAKLLDDQQGLALASTWQQLADDDVKREEDKNWWHRYAGEAMGQVYTWGVPPQAVLKQAQALRAKLDAQVGTAIKACVDKVLLVVGQAASTPVGFEVGTEGFTYLESTEGDGRVPLESALLPGVRTWKLNCEHGSLPSAQQAFDAYADLLVHGNTSRLLTLATPAATGASRGAGAAAAVPALPALRRNRPSRRPASALPAGGEGAVFNRRADADGGPGAPAGRRAQPPLQVAVLNGSLTFVKQPLMIGHYRSLTLTGTEAVVNRHLGGAMAQSLQAGLYPSDPGTQRTFFNRKVDPDNPWQAPRPAAAIVVGLGEEGNLTAAQLEITVSQGVKGWSQRAHEAGHGPDDAIEMAATLIGSGGLGVSAGGSARAIARGVWLANQRLAGAGWPMVTRLVIVEWYLDRAAEAWRGLRLLAEANPKAYAIDDRITSGVGPLRRQPDSGYRGTNYDLISISGPADGQISFELDTRRARSEVRAQHTQPALVRKLVERAATARSSDPRLGHTLFQLLVPLELKPFLSGTDRAVLKLDNRTAPIPWELLDTAPADADSARIGGALKPWSIRTQLLRTLSTETFRNNPLDANAEDAVLVIGAPNTEGTAYPPLEGAKQEAKAVARLLAGPGGIDPKLLVPLVEDDEFDVIIGALMARPYRIVHVAGHGAPKQVDEQTGALLSKGGVVLSEGVFLGPDEIEKLETVPELVFVNCCHLGGHDAKQTLSLDQPVAFAAGMADALIQMGVRCVVAAGWAVDDDAAEIFATRFYSALLAGEPFITAVALAREDTWTRSPRSKTWAAYQCYGDPNWTFRRGTGDAQASSRDARRDGRGGTSGVAEGIASPAGLALVLEDLAIRTRYASGDVAAQQEQARVQLRELQDQHGDAWGGMGAVAEAFGVAWEAAQDRDAAIACYGRALCANDASASVKAHEQLGKLQVERAWAIAQAAGTNAATLGQMREELAMAVRELQTLVALQPTMERLTLAGLAWQRQGQLQAQGGLAAESAGSLAMALQAYRRAETDAADAGDPRLFEAALRRMAVELVLHAADKAAPGLVSADLARTRRSLQAWHDSEPNFRSHADAIHLDIFEVLTAGTLAQRQPALAAAYAALQAQVAAVPLWAQALDAVGWVLDTPALLKSAANRAAAGKLLKQLRGYAQAPTA